MTGDKHDKPEPKSVPDSMILDAFNVSEDFEERLNTTVARPDLPGPRAPEAKLEYHKPFALEINDNFDAPAAPAPVAHASATPAPQQPQRTVQPPQRMSTPPAREEVKNDPGQSQYQFYTRRLREKHDEYPDDNEENSIKQSANVLLYILEEFQFPIDEEKTAKIVRRMKRILDLPAVPPEQAPVRKAREPFRSQPLKDNVIALYKMHMRRYTEYRDEQKKQQALEEERKRQQTEAEERAKAEQKRIDKEKRRAQASQAISEEKLRQLEAEFDEMMLLTASSHGISAAKLMRFGYEEPEPESGPPPVLPAAKPKAHKSSHSRGPKTVSAAMAAHAPLKSAATEKPAPAPAPGAKPAPAAEPAPPKESASAAEQQRQGPLTPQEIIERNKERRRQRGLI